MIKRLASGFSACRDANLLITVPGEGRGCQGRTRMRRPLNLPQDAGMKPWLQLRMADLVDQRPAGADDDVHFTEALVATVLDEYTAPGQIVLDPFAGP